MNNKEFRFLIRISIIIVLFIISFFILFNPYEKIPLSKENNNTLIKVSEDEIFQPSITNTIRDIFQVPFDLKWYNICFENKDTKIIFPNGGIDENVNNLLTFNNQTKLIIPSGEKRCILYKFNEGFTFEWDFGYLLNFSKISIPQGECSIVTLKRDLDVYAQPEFKSIIVKNILFLFACFASILLLLGTINFIQFGIKKK